MDAPEALYRLIQARARPISPTLAETSFTNRPSRAARPAAAAASGGGRSAASAAAGGAAGGGARAAEAPSPSPRPHNLDTGRLLAQSYGSDADILALLQPRPSLSADEPDGQFFSAEAYAAQRMHPVDKDAAAAAANEKAADGPARFF
jgi:hypothetical protein